MNDVLIKVLITLMWYTVIKTVSGFTIVLTVIGLGMLAWFSLCELVEHLADKHHWY
jgi:hypothetical protein